MWPSAGTRLTLAWCWYVMAGVIIFGGLRAIARTAEILVPAMALCYLLLALFIMFTNIGKLPDVLADDFPQCVWP